MSKINNFASLIFIIPVDETYYNNKNNSLKTNYLNKEINYYNSLDNLNINLNNFCDVKNLNNKEKFRNINLNNKNYKNNYNNNEIIKFTKIFLTNNWKTKIKKYLYKSKNKYYNFFNEY